MKIYIEKDGNYILIGDNMQKSNLETDYEQEDFMTEAMDKLEEARLKSEIYRQKNSKYLVKKLNTNIYTRNYDN